MSLFDALLVGHLVGDFLVQTAWMADNKATRILPLLVHVTIYGLAVVAAGGILVPHGRFLFWALPVLIVTHAALDQRSFVRFWVRSVQGVHRDEDRWLYVVGDQVFHVLVLAVIAVVAANSG